jgi:hypothetical protein
MRRLGRLTGGSAGSERETGGEVSEAEDLREVGVDLVSFCKDRVIGVPFRDPTHEKAAAGAPSRGSESRLG